MIPALLEKSLPLPRASYVTPTGQLHFAQLLEDFRAFWVQHAETFLALSFPRRRESRCVTQPRLTQ